MFAFALVALIALDTALHPALPVAAAGPAALSFDGFNDYVEVSNSTGLRIPVNITLEARIKPQAVNGYRGVAGKHNYEIGVRAAGNGFRAVFAFSRNSGSWIEVESGELALNQWHHIAGTYDGSNMRLFVNGARVASILTSGQIDQSNDSFRIGSTEFFNDYFQGAIDEVRLSNSIRYVGNFIPSQLPFEPDASTRGLWHFDEGTGNTTADSSGNGHHGTLSGGPAWIADSPFNGPDTTPPQISAVMVGSLTTSSARISWLTSEQATSQIEYGLTTDYGFFTNVDSALVAEHAQPITGLSPERSYHFRVISRDAAGNEAISGDFTFTTPAFDPPSAPLLSGIGTSGITQDSATVSWTTDVPADSQLEYGLTTAYGSVLPLDPTLTVNHSMQIDGLVPSTTYHFRVRSRGANGELTISSNAVFTTAGTSAATVGQWQAAMNWPLVAVHAVMLPNSKILLWDAWELKPNVFARVWDPTSQTFTAVTNQFSSVFCAGHSLLADGRALVAGGYTSDGVGIKDANIFNPATNAWSKVANMAYERWYPSTNVLPDGRVIALGGQIRPGLMADIPEVYDPVMNTWTEMPGAQLNVGEYPNTYLLPDGRLFMVAAPDARSRTLDIEAQQWSLVGEAPVPTGSSVMYRPGKILATGGGTNNADPVTSAAAVIDMNQANPAWRSIMPMSAPRFQHNLVALPDGKVFAVGGSTQYSLVSAQGTRQAEIWDPENEEWSSAGTMRDLRMYHSTALLLPDGRVLVAGGGRVNPAVDYLTAEIYSPPYLYKGARPQISDAPTTASVGRTIVVQTPNAGSIAAVALVRVPSVTHTINPDQRYVPLSFSAHEDSLDVQIPANANEVPPGPYMLFIVNSNGVPSVASMITIDTASADTQAPTVSLTAPSEGSTVSGTIILNAEVSDDVGVASVQFRVDGVGLGTPATLAPYSLEVDTTLLTNGTHTLSAYARDRAGNSSEATVTVTVVNQQPPTPTPTGGPLTLLGNDTVLDNPDSHAAGSAEAFQYLAEASGTVGHIHLYVDSPNAAEEIVVGLYTNTRDDNPGVLLSQATMTNPVPGSWNIVDMPPTSITGGARYWIAVLSPVGGGRVHFRDTFTGLKAQESAQGDLSILPANWTPGATYFNSPMSAYAVQLDIGSQPTNTPTATVTASNTATSTATSTHTPTATPTRTATATRTVTASSTPTALVSPTSTPTASAPAGSAGFPASGVLDTFNRTAGPLNGSWRYNIGGYRLANNQLDINAGGEIYWGGSSFGADQEAFVTLSTIDPASVEIDLLLKAQGTNGYEDGSLLIWYDQSGRQVQVWSFARSQGWVHHGSSMPVTFAAGDQFGARASATGLVTVYRNGVSIGSAHVSSWPYATNGGAIGLWFVNAANGTVDDFGGGTVAAPIPPSPTATRTATASATATSTSTASSTPTATRTATATSTSAASSTPTATRTVTASATATSTSAASSTPTATRTVTASATATVSSAGFPASGVLDTFNRSNGPLSGSWTFNTGGYRITSNRLDIDNGGEIYWSGGRFGADQEAYVTLSTIDPASAEIDLLLKAQGTNGYEDGVLLVWYDHGGQQVQVWSFTRSQAWVQHGASMPVRFAAGDQFGARASATGIVTVYRNGVSIGSANVSSWPYAASGGAIGLWFVNATNGTVDDFGGGTVAAQATPTATTTRTPAAMAMRASTALGGRSFLVAPVSAPAAFGQSGSRFYCDLHRKAGNSDEKLSYPEGVINSQAMPGYGD
jgi:hypothetical protein